MSRPTKFIIRCGDQDPDSCYSSYWGCLNVWGSLSLWVGLNLWGGLNPKDNLILCASINPQMVVLRKAWPFFRLNYRMISPGLVFKWTGQEQNGPVGRKAIEGCRNIFAMGTLFLIHFWFLGGPTVNQRHSRVRHGLSKTRYFFSFQSACPRDKGKNMKSWNIIVNWNMFYRQERKPRVQATFLCGFNGGGRGVKMDPTLLRLLNF